MHGNGIDGLAVVTDSHLLLSTRTTTISLSARPKAIVLDNGYVNQTVNTVWDATDLTYVLRGTIVIAGAYDFFTFNPTTGATTPAPVPNLHELHHRDPTRRLADHPGRAARHRAGRRHDDSQPRPVGHRQAVERQHPE